MRKWTYVYVNKIRVYFFKKNLPHFSVKCKLSNALIFLSDRVLKLEPINVRLKDRDHDTPSHTYYKRRFYLILCSDDRARLPKKFSFTVQGTIKKLCNILHTRKYSWHRRCSGDLRLKTVPDTIEALDAPYLTAWPPRPPSRPWSPVNIGVSGRPQLYSG